MEKEKSGWKIVNLKGLSEKEKLEEVFRLILLKVLCYKQVNGKYVIFKHDEENTKKTIDEIMDIIKVAILEQ